MLTECLRIPYQVIYSFFSLLTLNFLWAQLKDHCWQKINSGYCCQFQKVWKRENNMVVSVAWMMLLDTTHIEWKCLTISKCSGMIKPISLGWHWYIKSVEKIDLFVRSGRALFWMFGDSLTDHQSNSDLSRSISLANQPPVSILWKGIELPSSLLEYPCHCSIIKRQFLTTRPKNIFFLPPQKRQKSLDTVAVLVCYNIGSICNFTPTMLKACLRLLIHLEASRICVSGSRITNLVQLTVGSQPTRVCFSNSSLAVYYCLPLFLKTNPTFGAYALQRDLFSIEVSLKNSKNKSLRLSRGALRACPALPVLVY